MRSRYKKPRPTGAGTNSPRRHLAGGCTAVYTGKRSYLDQFCGRVGGYEFTVQDSRVIAARDRDGALITYTYGTASGYYESTFTDGELSEVSHSVLFEDADGTLRQKTVRSEPEDMPEIRRYLAAFTSGEVPFDEAYREIDLLISIHGRDYYFTRIGGAWRAAPAQDAGQRMD